MDHLSAPLKLKNWCLSFNDASFPPSGKMWPHIWLLFSLCSLLLPIISAGPDSDKLRLLGQGGFSRCAFTSIKGEMPKPAQDQKRWQACGEVLLFCIWWTILEVIKPGLCPLVQQLGLHSISRLFILAQSQGDMVFFHYARLTDEEGWGGRLHGAGLWFPCYLR